MYEFTKWFDRARERHSATGAFSEADTAENLIEQLFFGVRLKRVGAIGVYVELHQSSLTSELSAHMLSFCAPYEDLSETVETTIVKIDIKGGALTTVKIEAPPPDSRHIYRIDLALELVTEENKTIRLGNASAALVKDALRAKKYRYSDPGIPSVIWPAKDRAVRVVGKFFGSFAENAKALCPNCFGNGSMVSMHIPEADKASGATGYDLFSRNLLSGRTACEVCGGSGGKYLAWYVAENPMLKKTAFVPGTGIQLDGGGKL